MKFNITRWEKFWIISYHLIEPILVALLMGTCLEISQAETLIDMVITGCILVPLLLTPHVSRIKIKMGCCIFMCVASFFWLSFKIYCYLCPEQFTMLSQTMTYFLGVNRDNLVQTILPDIGIILTTLLLIWFYVHAKAQAIAREQILTKMAHQVKIKYLHPVYGQSKMTFFVIAYTFFLIDSFVYQTIV